MLKALTSYFTKSRAMTFIALFLLVITTSATVGAQSTIEIQDEAPAQESFVSDEPLPSIAEPITDEIHIDEVDGTMGAIEGEHAKSSGLPQFDLATAPSQLFWLAVTFVIMYVFFAKKTLPTLSSTIESRRSTIRNDILTAEKLSADVEKTKTEYETAMQQARNDARQAVLSVETAARDAAEKQNDAFKEKSAAAVVELEKKAEAEKQRVMNDLEKVAGEVASEIISSLSGITVSDKELQQAVKSQLTPATSTPNKKKAA